MGIVMRAGWDPVPVSPGLSGPAARGRLALLFNVTGSGIVEVALWALLHPALKILALEVSTPVPAPSASAEG